MAKASNNEYPSVLFAEQASNVTTPGTGLWRAFFKSDGLYVIDDAGAVTGPLSTGGGGGTDTFASELVHVRDQKASGTDAGASSTGSWLTRTLNTEVTNEVTGASLATNQVTLPAGTYWAEWSAPAFRSNGHQTRLRNATDGTTLLVGSSEYGASSAAYAQSRSLGAGRFTLASSKAIELQHRVAAAQASNGLGVAAGFGESEVFADLRVWKVA